MTDEGPRPIVVLIILILAIILLGILFALIKLFLIDPPQTIMQESGRIEVFFCPTQQCEARLAQELNDSATSACAFYELNLPGIAEVLSKENTRLLLFEDEAHKAPANLTFTRIPSNGLMHDKFCILDLATEPHIVTGSMNPTQNDAHRNDNNLLVIHSRTLARRYQAELDEMAARKQTYTKNSPRPAVINLSGTVVEQRFCPQEQCETAILRRLAQARHEIVFMIFTFTSDPIGDKLLAAKGSGLHIQGVMEKRQNSEYAEYDKLIAAGIDVRLDGNKNTMHHKVFIIDNRTIITGSFNPTAGANEKNDENLLIIDDEALAMQYRQEFERVYAAGEIGES